MSALADTAAPGRRRLRLRLATPATYVVGLAVVAVTVVPLAYVFLGGFRTTAQINNSPTGLPHPWVIGNYQAILASSVFWQYLINSSVIAVTATALTVATGSMAAFALSRYSFPGREGFYTLFTVGLLFPLGVASLPLYLLLQRIGLQDNLLGVAIPEAAFQLAITIVILRPFMRAVPVEIEDAALVDGASRLRFFIRIMLPLCRPALTTVALVTFIFSWNQYLLPFLVFASQNHFTLPLGVATFQSQYSQNTASIFAFTALSMVPALSVFVLAERQLVGGVSGAVKG
jgi:raffinose/stachyose/melibiose transport system permease protein